MAKQATRRVDIVKKPNGWVAHTKSGRTFATGRHEEGGGEEHRDEGPPWDTADECADSRPYWPHPGRAHLPPFGRFPVEQGLS